MLHALFLKQKMHCPAGLSLLHLLKSLLVLITTKPLELTQALQISLQRLQLTQTVLGLQVSINIGQSHTRQMHQIIKSLHLDSYQSLTAIHPQVMTTVSLQRAQRTQTKPPTLLFGFTKHQELPGLPIVSHSKVLLALLELHLLPLLSSSPFDHRRVPKAKLFL